MNTALHGDARQGQGLVKLLCKTHTKSYCGAKFCCTAKNYYSEAVLKSSETFLLVFKQAQKRVPQLRMCIWHRWRQTEA